MKEVLALYRELCNSLGAGTVCEAFCQKLKQTLQDILDTIPLEARLGIRPCGPHTKELLDRFDFSQRNVVGIFDRQPGADAFNGYPCFPVEELWEKGCDVVVISSFYLREEIKEEYQSYPVRILDIYEELEKRGIELIAPFYCYHAEEALVLNYFYLRFHKARDKDETEAALEAFLRAAVEQKDFVMLSKLYKECGGEKGKYPVLIRAWEKTEKLLSTIRRCIQAREQEDIFVFFTDCVPYSELNWFPALREIAQKGCFFQRAYTHTPFTNPAMRAIFRGVLPIDDFDQTEVKIDSGNSELMRYLEEKGYCVQIATYSGSVHPNHTVGKYVEATPCMLKWWDGILNILGSDKPCFYVFHFVAEPHPPYYAPTVGAVVAPYVSSAQQEGQIQAAFQYLDECLALYHEIAGNKTQIFFSDHGFPLFYSKQKVWQDTYAPWAEERLHTYCFAVGKSIPKVQVTRFFPYKNFKWLIKWILEPDQYRLEDACTDEVEFQDVDFYNRDTVAHFLKLGLIRSKVAYRGILNYDCKYVVNGLGEEFFYKRDADGREEQAVLEDGELRSKLQEKCGTQFLDVYALDKFKYSRRLYEYLKNGANR